ncbi:rod shape-determining protein MreD [Candidatus Methylospira mobilis]|uniref:Rod shape-determining protein MreD n=1 Tax=Candidatus Methylospira mobilis TaxID=1808979 RepID=A0A5Q0BC91_9GAMM|nr:rod shape-determining protein MreD [Candidatus Methylospira mobilis]QFY41485.1 rod shape-determining protein MreD [Candidatus Methylospira mobilis]WNV05286.1 rod shape-determining protein MreD [Candidatus Methylospira mobilis]
MKHVNPYALGVIVASIGLAMMLRIAAESPILAAINPDWVLMFVLYWNMAAPSRVGIGFAWVTGLFMDVLTGRLLGQHALTYTIVAYLCIRLHRQLRNHTLLQQSLIILLLLLIDQLLIFWTQKIRQVDSIDWLYWAAPFTGALLWPMVFMVLRHVRRSFNVA